MIPGQMDLSSQMNHWIALTAELEDTREAIAKAVFKQFKAGKIYSEYAIDLCRKIDDLYKDAKKYEQELEEDFRGYTEIGDKKQKNVAQKAQEQVGSLLSRFYIKSQVAAYKRNFREQYLELGIRAVVAFEDGTPLSDDPNLAKMCRYALKLKKDGDDRWEEIQILHREKVHGNAFLGAVQQFFTNLAVWGRTHGVPFVQKYLNIDENTTRRLRDEYRKKFQSGKD